jgi:hypothetical protein
MSFSLRRLSALIGNDISMRTKTILISILASVLFFALFSGDDVNHYSAYFFLLYVSGFWITSHIFDDCLRPQKATLFLMLPCSNFERFLSKWLLAAVIFPLSLLVLYYLFSALGIFLHEFVSHESLEMISLAVPHLWVGLERYLVLQSLVMLAAISFRSHALIKLFLMAGVLLIGILIFSGTLSWLFCPHCSEADVLGDISTMSSLMHMANIVFWTASAPLAWLVTYLKITELEVRS